MYRITYDPGAVTELADDLAQVNELIRQHGHGSTTITLEYIDPPRCDHAGD